MQQSPALPASIGYNLGNARRHNTTSIVLKPEHEQLISEALQTGAYRNSDEVIGHALEMLHSEYEWLRDHKDRIEARIDRALAQFERGEFLSPDESRADMERRKTSWLNEHRRSS